MTFAQLAKLGYGSRLIPIVPPKAEISERSTLFKRIQAGDDARGKSPGVRWPDGKWSGFDWRAHQTIESDLPRWEAMGAGAGVKCDDALVAIDADTLNEDIARTIKGIVEKWLGKCPVRIGRYPKALYLVRVSAPYRYARVEFGKANGHPRERVEILSSGKQFVALGVHPVTMEPYRWPLGLPDLAALPLAAPATLDGLIEALKAALPDAGPVAREGVGAEGVEVDQASLRGDPALVRAAAEALSNTTEKFPSRESYLGVGYRIKAALPDDPAMAFELFSGWCAAWCDPNGRSNDPDIVAGDWARMKGPFRRGAESLYRLAQEMSGGAFNVAAIKFHENAIEAPAPSTHGFNIVKASSFDGLPVPQQRWLVKDIIPAQNVTMLAGDGATGKSLIAVQLGVAHVTGTPWLGCEVERGRALFFTAEDEMDELQRRLVDICRPPSMFGLVDLDDLHLVSFNGMDAVMAAPVGKEGLLGVTPIFKRLRLALDALRPSLLFLDTQADLFGGDENKRIHARQFIGMLQGLAKEFETTVILLSHPSLSGMSTGSGMSGNTAWNNSVRSRLYLSRRFEKDNSEPDPDVRVLTTKKANRSRNGGKLVLRYSRGRFICEGVEDDTPAADRERTVDETFLAILDRMIGEGRPVSHKETANNFAPAAFEKNPLARSITAMAFQASMERLFASGAIKTEEYGPPSKRYKQIARSEIKPDSGDLFGE